MNISRNIELLQKLIDKSKSLVDKTANNSEFKTWRNLVERTLIRVFGPESIEVKQFNKLRFEYNGMSVSGYDLTSTHLGYYRKSFETAVSSLENYIEEFNEELTVEIIEPVSSSTGLKSLIKVFISHSSTDRNVVEELIELLETIGLNSTQIFCSSFEGYGIDFGDNFLERIKSELDENVLVLFLLSNNFYASPISLCEMGATWMKTNQHIPILIPPFEFKDIRGVIPLTQGFIITEELSLNQFKIQIEKLFDINNVLSISTWERKRDRIIKRIEGHI